MTRIACTLMCLALAACGAAPVQQGRAVAVGTEVTLPPGDMVRVKAAELAVRFVGVSEDSRCPRDVTCVWAGEVKVQLEIHLAAQAASQTEVRAGDSTVAGAYRISLVRVEPQPKTGAKIAPQHYRATLKIDEAT
jgi:hypothetical protein